MKSSYRQENLKTRHKCQGTRNFRSMKSSYRQDDSVNTCCLPDGTVFVNSGTLKEISDDSILAAIIAHELGHAAARHGNESLTRMLIVPTGGVAFEEWLTGVVPALNSGEGVSLIRLAYGIGGAVGFRLPRNRREEFEADRLGVRYLVRAGFDPKAAVRLFEYFNTIDPQKLGILLSLLSTHPVNDKRIEHVGRCLMNPICTKCRRWAWAAK